LQNKKAIPEDGFFVAKKTSIGGAMRRLYLSLVLTNL